MPVVSYSVSEKSFFFPLLVVAATKMCWSLLLFLLLLKGVTHLGPQEGF